MPSNKPVIHTVHGERMTVREAARRLGVTQSTLEGWRTNNRGRDGSRGTLEAAWDWYVAVAEGRLPRHRGAEKERHLVHGVWMTVYEVAQRLGVAPWTIKRWRSDHRHPDGSMALMVEAWDHYAAVKRGEIPWRAPKPGQLYRMRGERVTIAQAAVILGVKEATLRQYLWAKGCSLDDAARYYEKKRTDAAVKAIMGIINGK